MLQVAVNCLYVNLIVLVLLLPPHSCMQYIQLASSHPHYGYRKCGGIVVEGGKEGYAKIGGKELIISHQLSDRNYTEKCYPITKLRSWKVGVMVSGAILLSDSATKWCFLTLLLCLVCLFFFLPMSERPKGAFLGPGARVLSQSL